MSLIAHIAHEKTNALIALTASAPFTLLNLLDGFTLMGVAKVFIAPVLVGIAIKHYEMKYKERKGKKEQE